MKKGECQICGKQVELDPQNQNKISEHYTYGGVCEGYGMKPVD